MLGRGGWWGWGGERGEEGRAAKDADNELKGIRKVEKKDDWRIETDSERSLSTEEKRTRKNINKTIKNCTKSINQNTNPGRTTDVNRDKQKTPKR